MRSTFPLPVLLLSASMAAQGVVELRLNELSIDPVGPNAGAQVVEVLVTGNMPLDLTGWHLASGSGSRPLPALQIQPQRIARIHLGLAGTSTPADIFLPGFPELGLRDSLAVFRSATFTAAEIEDFASWGGGQANIQAAILAGQWPSTLLSIPQQVVEGPTLAHLGAASFVGQDHPDAWYLDGTPTLGLENDPGTIFNLGLGCPGLGSFAPVLGAARPESRPWVGERFELDMGNLAPGQGFVLLVFGLRRTPPVLLDAFGMPGCTFHVSVDAVVGVPSSAGRSLFATTVPPSQGLTGFTFHVQAFVPTLQAGNRLGALVTNALIHTVGSR